VQSQKENLAPIPNYGKQSIYNRIIRIINGLIVKKIYATSLQFTLYPAYWHWKFSKSPKTIERDEEVNCNQYLTQKPNFGAGIGHQLANWNTGLYFATYFKVKFAHYPFSSAKWENFLGFGEGEIKALDLLKTRKFKRVRLPAFDSKDQKQIDLISEIIRSYKKENVLFTLEVDQGYERQCDTADLISEKFFGASARGQDKIIFSKDEFNIAVHIRRRMRVESQEVWQNRGLDNQYFLTCLNNVLDILRTDKKIRVYLFSQGGKEDFPEFNNFSEIVYCMEMGAEDSFLQMVHADLLISSKSSFSYKPALISQGIQICPASFWHSFPEKENYILADNEGQFDKGKLRKILAVTG
jgi:hypothetical protein